MADHRKAIFQILELNEGTMQNAVKWCLDMFFLLSGSGQHQELPWYLVWSSNICPGNYTCIAIFPQDLTLCIVKYWFASTESQNFVCQGAIPNLLENTKEEFFQKTIKIIKESADICWEQLKGINAITCPSKPEGSMFVMVCESIYIYTLPCFRTPWAIC